MDSPILGMCEGYGLKTVYRGPRSHAERLVKSSPRTQALTNIMGPRKGPCLPSHSPSNLLMAR